MQLKSQCISSVRGGVRGVEWGKGPGEKHFLVGAAGLGIEQPWQALKCQTLKGYLTIQETSMDLCFPCTLRPVQGEGVSRGLQSLGF